MLGNPIHIRHEKPPEDAKQFSEVNFYTIVEKEIFYTNPEAFGFEPKKGVITFSELYPVYRLEPDFAFGESSQIIRENPKEWIAVIYQNEKPVNAIGVYQNKEGHFELSQVGHPPELPKGILTILTLKEDEKLIHEFPMDIYYAKVTSI